MPQSRGGGMNMMNVPKPVSSRILRVKRTEHGVILVSRRYKLRILAVSPSILHVSYTERRTFSHEDKPELAGVLQGSDVKDGWSLSLPQPAESIFEVIPDLPAVIDKTVPAVCPNRFEYKDMRLIQDKAEIL